MEGPTATTADFAAAARTLSEASRHLGLQAPGFRSPPRRPGADRTVRRWGDGSATVAVRVHSRPLGAVLADMVEGVVVANRLTPAASARARTALWEALAEGRGGGRVPSPGTARVA